MPALRIIALLLIIIAPTQYNVSYYTAKASPQTPPPAIPLTGGPVVNNDPNLSIEVVYKGLEYPTGMAFLGPNDILVLEKNSGRVERIVNGTMQDDPLKDFAVATQDERGLLGIALADNNRGSDAAATYAFLYLTESGGGSDGDDMDGGVEPAGNRLYRFELQHYDEGDSGKMQLVNGKLLIDLPADLGTHHNGGKVLVGPDQNIYFVIGDVEGHDTKAQNAKDGPLPDGTSAIYRITRRANR